MKGCADRDGCGRVAELHGGPGLVKQGKYYVCYMCVVMPTKFPQPTFKHAQEQTGRYAEPDASLKKKVPTAGRLHPSKRKPTT